MLAILEVHLDCVKLHGLWRLAVSWGLILTCVLSVFDSVQSASQAPGPPATQSEEVALRAVVESYFAACGKKDLAGVVALWSEKSPNLSAYKQRLPQQFANEDLSFGLPAISRIKVENEKAGLRAAITVTSINLKSRQKSVQPSIRTFELVKEAGTWKVWRFVLAAEDLAEALIKSGSQAERAALLTEERELVTVQLGQVLLGQGQQVLNQGGYDRGREIYELALQVAERCGDQSLLARSLLSIGRAHRSQGDYAQAQEYFQKSLKISEELGDKSGMASTLISIGILHGSQGNYAQALPPYRQSLRLSEEIGDRAAVSRALNNIGIVHKLQGDYAQALQPGRALGLRDGAWAHRHGRRCDRVVLGAVRSRLSDDRGQSMESRIIQHDCPDGRVSQAVQGQI